MSKSKEKSNTDNPLTGKKLFGASRRGMYFALVFVMLFGFIGAYFIFSSHAAGTASFALTPLSNTLAQGANFTVTVSENSGSEAVNAVQADLSYDPTKVDFISIDGNSSAFETSAQASGGNGTVNIARAKLGGSVTGTQTVAVVTFKLKATSGNVVIGMKATSNILRASDSTGVWNGTLTSVTYTIQLKPGDTNGDGLIDIFDLSPLANNYGKSGQTRAQGDLNGDGVINITDLSILAANWGK